MIKDKMVELTEICARRNVRTLALFGSAAKDTFESNSSDLDFLVTFNSTQPSEHADNFFGLLEGLEELFGVPIDLVEASTIKNPYFRDAVEESMMQIYDAALSAGIPLWIKGTDSFSSNRRRRNSLCNSKQSSIRNR